MNNLLASFSLEFPILLPKGIQVDWTPDASSLATDHLRGLGHACMGPVAIIFMKWARWFTTMVAELTARKGAVPAPQSTLCRTWWRSGWWGHWGDLRGEFDENNSTATCWICVQGQQQGWWEKIMLIATNISCWLSTATHTTQQGNDDHHRWGEKLNSTNIMSCSVSAQNSNKDDDERNSKFNENELCFHERNS